MTREEERATRRLRDSKARVLTYVSTMTYVGRRDLYLALHWAVSIREIKQRQLLLGKELAESVNETAMSAFLAVLLEKSAILDDLTVSDTPFSRAKENTATFGPNQGNPTPADQAKAA